MKLKYTTLKPAEDELIIKKSRFHSLIFNIRSEDEAKSIIGDVRENYKDATHVCYAYVLSAAANIERFSDDGEPSGTAGMPMLEVIKNSNLSEVLAIVVRYFGGIKLGAGGLVRAYSESIKNCIQKATPVEFIFSNIYQLNLDFSLGKKINQLLSNFVCKTLEISYNDSGVSLTLAVPIEIDFNKTITEFSLGKINPTLTTTEYIEFD